MSGPFATYIRPYRTRLLLGACCIAIAQAASAVIPMQLRDAVDFLEGGTGADALLAGLHPHVYRIAALAAAVAAGSYAMRRLLGAASTRIEYDIRAAYFAHLLSLPLSYYQSRHTGDLMARATNDLNAVRIFFTYGIRGMVETTLVFCFSIALMLTMDWQLTLTVLLPLPLMSLFIIRMAALVHTRFRAIQEFFGQISNFIQENLSGIRVVKAYVQSGSQMEAFEGLNSEYLERNRHLIRTRAVYREIHYYAIFFPFTEFVGTMGMAMVIYYGASAVIETRIELGVLVAFLQYIRRFFRPIMDISDRYALLQSAMAASERIFALLDTPTEPVGCPGGQARPGPAPAIEFEHVTFRYDERAPEAVLRDVSFAVPAGHSLALVGATGSGKTTVVNLLCRFYDIQEGSIRVHGRDVRQWDVEELRRRVGIVQQDVFLFSGDILGNIRLGDDSIGRPQVEAATAYVNAEGFIRRLPRGLDQPVAERGSTLSAGQRQLLSFARALVAEPEILVLDEATSSIDTETEQLIRDAIGKLMHDRTSVVIAHRLSTIRTADQIIVLHHGQVREQGRHQELIQQGGIYTRLYRLHLSAGQAGEQ